MQDTNKTNNKKRNRILIFFIILIFLSIIGYLFYYYLYGQFYESTDDAYVKQNIVYITPQVSGVVDEVNINTAQYVKYKEQIGHIDSKDIEIAFKNSKNSLAQSVRHIKELHKQKDKAKALISLRKIQVDKAESDFKRNQILFSNKAISKEVYDNFKYALEEAKENLNIAKKNYLSIKVLLKGENIYNNPQIKKAVLALEKAYINLKRCDILSPKSGIVAKKNFSVGSHVNPQTIIAAIVPKIGFWVDANFKETKLKNIRIGQSVKLYSDVYGKNIVFHGKVVGILPGTGSAFSLLPAQNATGNWIKIIQRVPVRISLNQKELQKYPLQVGNSMEVYVDTHIRNKKKLKKVKIRKPNFKTNLYKDALKNAKKIADEIIKKNL